MNSFRLLDPLWLLLLVPVVALVFFDITRRNGRAVLYSSVQVLKTLPRTFAQRIKSTLPWMRFVGLALVVAALARPQAGQEEFRIRTEGIAIQMVCDRSGSMQAMDFEDDDGQPADRLTAVKQVFRDFVAGKGDLPGRPDDLIGLVSFGGYAEGVCPLTLDHGVLLEILETVEVPKPVFDARGRLINEQLLQEEMATAIGDALALGTARVRDAKAKSRVLILLSDGENNFGVIDPLEAAAAAKAFGVKVYTIGIGTTGMAPFPEQDPFGRVRLTARPVKLDETLLKAIATETGGKYFNARDTASLEEVYAEIDALEKTETEGRLYTEYRELFAYFLFAGLGLIVFQMMLSTTRFRSLP